MANTSSYILVTYINSCPALRNSLPGLVATYRCLYILIEKEFLDSKNYQKPFSINSVELPLSRLNSFNNVYVVKQSIGITTTYEALNLFVYVEFDPNYGTRRLKRAI